MWLNGAHVCSALIEVFLRKLHAVHPLVQLFLFLAVLSKLLIQFMLCLKPVIQAVSAIRCTVLLVDSVRTNPNLIQARRMRGQRIVEWF